MKRQWRFAGGPNCPKNSIPSMQRHRHNVKTPPFGRGQIMVSGPLGGAMWLRCPPPYPLMFTNQSNEQRGDQVKVALHCKRLIA